MMKKRGICILLAAALLLAVLVGACGSPGSESSFGKGVSTAIDSLTSAKQLSGNRLVGIAMPTDKDRRWVRDAETIKTLLEDQGYVVELAYAENDGKVQRRQVKAMLDDDCNVIVVAAVEHAALAKALNGWDTSGTTVIAYETIISECPAVSYSVALDGYANGKMQGKGLVKLLGLKKQKIQGKHYNLEIFHQTGNGSGLYALLGALEELKPYLDRKILTIPSGQKSGAACGVSDAGETAKRLKTLTKKYYSTGRTLDAVLSTDDDVSVWLAKALEKDYRGSVYPLILGCCGNSESVRLLMEGRVAMTTVEENGKMAVRTAKMTEQVMSGKTVKLTRQDPKNPCDLPAYLFKPLSVGRKSAPKKLFHSGRYVMKKDGSVTVGSGTVKENTAKTGKGKN